MENKKIDIVKTKDNSLTLYSKEFDDNYHSINGAISESQHIFINSGLKELKGNSINVLEVGFGTGLNALCSLAFSIKNNIKINYIGIEPFPLNIDIISKLNYCDFFDIDNLKEQYFDMHLLPKNYPHYINDNFIFNLISDKIENIQLKESSFDIVYYDAFNPSKDYSVWSKDNFNKIFNSLKNEGLLLTYSSCGTVKRNLKDAGFEIEKIKGPEGKREIIRAKKLL